MTDSVIVTVDLGGESIDAGTAFFTRRRNSLATSFRYLDGFLRRRDAYAIDPSMPLTSGNHHLEGLPGAFQDASPDRWGKNLVGKKLRAQALAEGRTPPSISEVDHLIGVSDLTRQGALRFRVEPDGPFLDPDLAVPKLVELPRLLRAADAVARDGGDGNMTAIKTLLDAGSGSLGGARPKASVRDGDRLLIAKFPHHSDEWNVMAWEKTALDLAERAGIDVPPNQLLDLDGQSVLVLERFDREEGRRVGYMSAMTLIEGSDGDPRDYTEIAETLPEHGSRTNDDLHQMWRRIAFSVVIHNTDDHLRNHGFLRHSAGWRLSPLFDVNPNPDVTGQRVTGIGGAHQRSDEVAGLIAYTETFDLTRVDANQNLREVLDATASWRQVAAKNGIPESEQGRFAGAFDGIREELADRSSVTASSGPRRQNSEQPRVPKGAKGAGQFGHKPRPDPGARRP